MAKPMGIVIRKPHRKVNVTKAWKPQFSLSVLRYWRSQRPLEEIINIITNNKSIVLSGKLDKALSPPKRHG
jgi:hypothetical protein